MNLYLSDEIFTQRKTCREKFGKLCLRPFQPICKKNHLRWSFCKTSFRNFPSQMFDWVLNMPLSTTTTQRQSSIKNMFLEISQNSQENTCARVSFFKKEALTRVFSCEFCEISKKTFFIEDLWWLLLTTYAPLVNFRIINKQTKQSSDLFLPSP